MSANPRRSTVGSLLLPEMSEAESHPESQERKLSAHSSGARAGSIPSSLLSAVALGELLLTLVFSNWSCFCFRSFGLSR